MPPSIDSRILGSLLGLAVGDGLGSRFEGRSPNWIARCHSSWRDVTGDPPKELRYTDDTQMAIGVAETLADRGKIDPAVLRRRFASNFDPSRGYGSGARKVLEAMRDGLDSDFVARTAFPGGSYGNGAAMRVAPVGTFHARDLDRVWEAAREQSLPTHTHRLGIDGARLLATAVALATRGEPITAEALLRRGVAEEYVPKIEAACRVDAPERLARLGNGIAALESVPTAIACFLLSPNSYEETIGRAILLGGDADTIAAMAGAIAGAALGHEGIPKALLDRLEDGPTTKGRTYLETLARRLAAARV